MIICSHHPISSCKKLLFSSTVISIKMEHLTDIAIEYYDLYKLPDNLSAFHHLCSLVTSQQVPFATGRSIRKQLYIKAGFPLTQENLSTIDLSSIKGLTNDRKRVLLELCELSSSNEDMISQASKIKGIGPWTIKGANLLSNHPNVNLYEDSYIRSRLSEYLKQTISQSQCKSLISECHPNESEVSYCLWRITKKGIKSILNNKPLTKEDFL